MAEAQYRVQVRMTLSASAGPTFPPSAPRAAETAQRKSRVGLLLVGLVFMIVGAVILANRNSTGAPALDSKAPSVRYVPVSQKIASGQVLVRASGYVQYRFQITPDMQDAHVSGRFNASGGTGNDIEVVIANEDEFTNWINGHQARVFYSTQGRKTMDIFDVRLRPGTYYLALNNRFSTLSAKDVFLEVDLNSQRLETN